jgi:TfoX/Sxy family transcriptional regulator of competence genes
MSDTKSEVPADELALYQKLVATRPDVELKGAKMPYTSVNGHMFSFLTPAGTLALRLPTGAREAFLEKYEASLCVQHGRVMKEYVEVPAALLGQTRKLAEYFDQSYAHVASLAPKPTTRTNKKKATKKKTATKK